MPEDFSYLTTKFKSLNQEGVFIPLSVHIKLWVVDQFYSIHADTGAVKYLTDH